MDKDGHFTHAMIAKKTRRSQHINKPCPYCKLPFDPRTGIDSKASYTRQHVLPKRRGGGDDPSNLRACCRACNEDLAHPLIDDCPGALAALRATYGLKRGEVRDFVRFMRHTWSLNKLAPETP